MNLLFIHSLQILAPPISSSLPLQKANMIAHTLPILVVAVALGVRAIPTPAPQGVTALITPGRVLDSCIINYPGVYGISIRGVGSSAESSAATLRGAAAAGSGIARGAEGAASAASTGKGYISLCSMLY